MPRVQPSPRGVGSTAEPDARKGDKVKGQRHGNGPLPKGVFGLPRAITLFWTGELGMLFFSDTSFFNGARSFLYARYQTFIKVNEVKFEDVLFADAL